MEEVSTLNLRDDITIDFDRPQLVNAIHYTLAGNLLKLEHSFEHMTTHHMAGTATGNDGVAVPIAIVRTFPVFGDEMRAIVLISADDENEPDAKLDPLIVVMHFDMFSSVVVDAIYDNDDNEMLSLDPLKGTFSVVEQYTK